MTASLKDIANALNISTAAASRALNDRPGVSDELRQRVKDTASQLGYTVPHRKISGNPDKQETIIILYGHIGNNIIHDINLAIDHPLRNLGYQTLRYIIDPDQDFANESLRQTFIERIIEQGSIAGIVTCYLHLSDVHIAQLQKQNIPVVLIEHHTDYGRCVTINQQRASYKATVYLIEKGRKNVGCILPPEDGGQIWQDRLNGYRQALKDKNIPYDPTLIAYSDWIDIHQGYHATLKLLKQTPDLNAILYACDTLAAGGIKAIHETKKRIPQDIAIIGFDNEEFDQALTPTLSSVHQPIHRMASTALSLLLDTIEKDDTSHRAIQLETELIIRESC